VGYYELDTELIPRVIHFVWESPDVLPPWAKRHLAEFAALNLGYRIEVHSATALLPCYADAYAAAPTGAARADLIRYSALEQFGGWYFDLDCYPLRPLDDAVRAWGLDGARLFIGAQATRRSARWLNNAVLACWPGHDVWNVVRGAMPATNDTGSAFGSELMTRIANDRPDLFEVAGRAWFYGTTHGHKQTIAGHDRAMVRRQADTGGQMPFALHFRASQGDIE